MSLMGRAMTLAIGSGCEGFTHPRRDPLKAEGLPQAVLDAREVLGMERAEHALDELFLQARMFQIRAVLGWRRPTVFQCLRG